MRFLEKLLASLPAEQVTMVNGVAWVLLRPEAEQELLQDTADRLAQLALDESEAEEAGDD